MADGKVLIDIALNTSGIKASLNDVRKSIASAGSTIGSLGGSSKKAKSALELLANANSKLASKTNILKSALSSVKSYLSSYVSIYSIVDTIKEAIGLSSDLAEVQNVVDTTFEESADSIDNFAKTAVQSFGMSELSAKNFVSSFGSTLKAAGIEKDLDGMSIALTQLVGDFASFRNISYEDAFQKIQSAISGQTRGIRLYGVAVTDANLSNYALELGITKSTKAMTENEKIMLRISFMLKSMRDYAGDFAKTQDSWANQTRLLSETWKEFLVVMGDIFRVALTGVLKGMLKFVQNLVMVAKYVRGFIALIQDSSTKFDEFGNIISGKFAPPDYSGFGDGIESDMSNIEESANDASEALKGVLASYDDVQVLSKQSSGSLKSDSLTADDFNLTNLLAEQQAALDKYSTDIEMPEFNISKLQKAVDWYNNNLRPMFDWILDHKNEIFKALLLIVSGFLLFGLLKNIFSVVSTIAGLVTSIQTIVGLISAGGPVAIAIVGIIALIIGLIATFALLYISCKDFRDAANKMFKGVADYANEMFKSIQKSFEDVVDQFDDLTDALGELGIEWSDIFDAIFSGLGTILKANIAQITAFVNTFLNIVEGFLESLTGTIRFVGGIINGDWEAIWAGLVDITISKVRIITSLIDGLLSIVNEILKSFGSDFQFGYLNDMLDDARDKVVSDKYVKGKSKNSFQGFNNSNIVESNAVKNNTLGWFNSTGLNNGSTDISSLYRQQTNTNNYLNKINTALQQASNKEVSINLDGKTIGKASVDFINGTTIRTGKNPLLGT